MTSGTDVWKGYLLAWDETYTLIQSPFSKVDDRVFGADSDYTTLAIAALQHRVSLGDTIECISLAEGVNGSIFTMATDVDVADEARMILANGICSLEMMRRLFLSNVMFKSNFLNSKLLLRWMRTSNWPLLVLGKRNSKKPM